MSNVWNPTGVQTYNFLTNVYADPELEAKVKLECSDLYLQLLHFKSIGSKYCPRVLLTAEKMLKRFKVTDWDSIEKYITAPNQTALNNVKI